MLFGDFEEQYREYSSAKFAILPVPYDATSTWVKGADKGPEAFLDASFTLENYDVETGTEAYKHGIATLPFVTEDRTPELLCNKVQQEVTTLLNDGKFPVTIGGNHTVSIGAIRAMAQKYNNLTVLQLDAHSDLRPSYEGSELNHACVMNRAAEVAKITQVGIRSQCVEELPFFEKDRLFYAHQIFDNNQWQAKAIDTLTENVYVTIDLDVFDPSVLPSTGTPEPGGLTYYQVLHFLRNVFASKNVVGFDIVE
ncbi:MAG: agmatinase, partial [Paludibacteraceae bacterium]|nr:agmatinase [Paludibacteraceae bacterium]